ncbi:TPA: helix-turn-helix transcriptional regulator [Legionella pneumophila]|nr:AlpA family phage regulatory protein [Legionella pneumophila]
MSIKKSYCFFIYFYVLYTCFIWQYYIMTKLPEIGFLRANQIIGDKNANPPIPALIPIGKSTWWAGVKSGRFPKPIKFGSRITVWRVEDIREFIEKASL